MGSGITSGECGDQDTFNITEETVSQLLYTPADTIITTIVIPIIWCLGVTTNSTFLFVMFRIPTMRSDTNMYLANLALADLFYLSLSATYYIWGYLASPVAFHFPFLNSAECVSFFTVINIAYFAATALITMVSFERYLALCHPIKHLRIRGRGRTYRMVAICWLVGLVFAGLLAPRAAVLEVICVRWPNDDAYLRFPSAVAYCAGIHPLVAYLTPILNIPWLVAMLGNGYMYIRIIHMLSKRTGGNNGRVEYDQKALQIRNQVARMLVVNGVVFFLCQTPYTTMNLASWICLLAGIPNPLLALGRAEGWIVTIPELINTTVNPLIYSAMNKQFQAAFCQAFRCKDRPRQRSGINHITTTASKNQSNASTQTNIDTREAQL